MNTENEFDSPAGYELSLTPRHVDRFIAGEPTATEQVLSRVSEILRMRLRQAGVKGEEVEDLAQQCTLEVLRRAGNYDSELGEFESWISGFARRAAMSHRRDTARRIQREQNLEEYEVPGVMDHEEVDHGMALEGALSFLPVIDREILFMKFTMGMSSQEIADHSDMNPAQVRKRMSRAVERLRKDPQVRRALRL